MTIKEVEVQTGMNRANIRFYEGEGLICPQRRENGYRQYSEADVLALQKIRLLRTLNIPIEEIKSIQEGALPLAAALEKSLVAQCQSQERAQRVMALTQRLLEAGMEYETLDPSGCLQHLEGDSEGGLSLNLPWRRFFARDLDFMLCHYISSLVFWEFLHSSLLSILGGFVLMLLLEPLCLHLFGSTPGKAIFGIQVTDLEEKRLSFSAGVERTWTVLWEGTALRIPIVMYYFLYKSYTACEAGEPLPWEWDSEVTYKDDKVWRCAVYALAYLAVWGIQILTGLYMEGLV